MRIICVLSIIFTIFVLSGVAYLYFADPFGVNVFIFPSKNTQLENSVKSNINTNTNNNQEIILSPAQKDALDKIGVDPAVIPTNITPAVGDCFVEKIGQQRYDQILAGAVPTAIELLKIKPCL